MKQLLDTICTDVRQDVSGISQIYTEIDHMEQIWLKITDVEKLGIPARTIKRRCADESYITRKVPSRGKTGYSYEVALSCLPESCRTLFYNNIASASVEKPGRASLLSGSTSQADDSGSTVTPQNPEIEINLLAEMQDWERDYVLRFISLYHITKSMRGADLKQFLSIWSEKNPKYGFKYANFMRIKKLYEDSDCSISSIRPQWGKGGSTVPNEWAELYASEYLNQRQASSMSCWKNVLGKLKRQNPDLDVKSFPSHASFLRKLQSFYSESVIYYMRNGLAKWKAKYGYHISRHYDDILCGEVWVSDHVQSDVGVRLPDGTVKYLWITVWVDVKSTKWVGWYAHVESPKSDHIFTAFYRAAKRYGIPTDIIIDNGKDYRCKALSGGRLQQSWIKVEVPELEALSLFAALKISVHFAWPYNPESKICERTFSRVNAGFSRNCIGYRGPHIQKRPDNLKSETEQLWSEEQFKSQFDRYITEIYNREVSNGKMLAGQCPDELFDKEWPIALKTGRAFMVSAEALKMFCSPLSDTFRIKKSVVTDNKLNVRYWAPWMASENGTVVRMRRDFDDYSIAYFWEDATGRYLGYAGLDGNVSALADTPVAKSDLEEHIRRKRSVERQVRNIAKTVAKTNNDDFVENRLAAITALNDDRGYQPSPAAVSQNYLITAMDKVIAENNRRKADGYDFSNEADMSNDNQNNNTLDDLDLWGAKAVNF